MDFLEITTWEAYDLKGNCYVLIDLFDVIDNVFRDANINNFVDNNVKNSNELKYLTVENL